MHLHPLPNDSTSDWLDPTTSTPRGISWGKDGTILVVGTALAAVPLTLMAVSWEADVFVVEVVIRIFHATVLMAPTSAALRIRRVGFRGLYFGEWLAASMGVCGILSSPIAVFDPEPFIIVMGSVLLASLAAILPVLVVITLRWRNWFRGAVWQHWVGLGLWIGELAAVFFGLLLGIH